MECSAKPERCLVSESWCNHEHFLARKSICSIQVDESLVFNENVCWFWLRAEPFLPLYHFSLFPHFLFNLPHPSFMSPPALLSPPLPQMIVWGFWIPAKASFCHFSASHPSPFILSCLVSLFLSSPSTHFVSPCLSPPRPPPFFPPVCSVSLPVCQGKQCRKAPAEVSIKLVKDSQHRVKVWNRGEG